MQNHDALSGYRIALPLPPTAFRAGSPAKFINLMYAEGIERILCRAAVFAAVLAVHDVVRTVRMIFCEVKYPENGGAGRIERR